MKTPGSKKTVQVSVAPLTFEERIAPIKQREDQRRGGGNQALFEWKALAGNTAYLKMPDWALYNSKWDWKTWLNQHLNQATEDRSRALVIDLRGNEGGLDVGNEVIAHVIAAPLRLSTMRRLVRYRKVNADLTPYLDTWDKSFFDWGASAIELKAPWPTAPDQVSYLKLTRYDDNGAGDLIQPAAKRFQGKVVVLIDSTNSSATFQFAQAIQQNHLGTLVGQPTGGSQRGINGGAFFFLHLPHSAIEMDLPLIGTFPPSPMPDSGVKPDIFVQPNAGDIASGKDVVLAAALRYLSSGQR